MMRSFVNKDKPLGEKVNKKERKKKGPPESMDQLDVVTQQITFSFLTMKESN